MLNLPEVLLLPHKSILRIGNLLVVGLLVEGEVKIKNCLLEILGQVYFLPLLDGIYLYSLTISVYRFLTDMISVSPLDYSFLLRGLFRIATKILG